jgi:DNA-binding response OmpR family regulator
LIVDDDPNQGRSLAIGLRLEGFQVTVICDGEAALALIDSADFDAAIVDLMLPGINGIEIARQMRNRRPNTRVLLTSAYHLSENQIRRADCGVIGFIPKPFELDELADFLRTKISGAPESVRRVVNAR